MAKVNSKKISKTRAEKHHERIAVHASFIEILKEAKKHADKHPSSKKFT